MAWNNFATRFLLCILKTLDQIRNTCAKFRAIAIIADHLQNFEVARAANRIKLKRYFYNFILDKTHFRNRQKRSFFRISKTNSEIILIKILSFIRSNQPRKMVLHSFWSWAQKNQFGTSFNIFWATWKAQCNFETKTKRFYERVCPAMSPIASYF